MKTTINCFIPFADAAQAEKTIQGLKSSNLVKDIYLLVTEDTEVPLQGCRILHVPALNSTATMRIIAAHSDADYTLFYTKYTTLKLGMFALERMTRIAEDSVAGMVYADHYQVSEGIQKNAPVIDYQFGSLRDDFNFGSVRNSKTNGMRNMSTDSCNTTLVLRFCTSRLVSLANTSTGVPIAPNAVATLLAIRLTTAENTGLNPRLIRMAAGIATAVPKPAIASSNPPKPQVNSNT